MADSQPRPSSIAPHRKNTLTLPPPKLTFREVSVPTQEGGEPIVDKWIYVFIESSGELYAEIYAESEDLWRVEYRPAAKRKAAERFDARTEGDITIDRKRLQSGDYRAFLSPARASDDAVELLKKHLAELTTAVALGTSSKGIPYAYIHDAFRVAEFQHEQYLFAYKQWAAFVSDRERQARLFIAGTLDAWLSDGDQAEVGKYLKSKKGPAKVVKAYEASEKQRRKEAEECLVPALFTMDTVEHVAIDLSAQQGAKKDLAVGLLHWGIVSENLLCVAPGRVYANKLMKENKALPAAILMGDTTPPNLYGAHTTFKKAYEASAFTVLHLLAARVKQLSESVSPRGVQEKIILYLRKLGLETELKGNYKRIQERLEAGDKITKRLKGTQRSSVVRSYQKLARKAGSQIPDYGKDAQEVLDTAHRLEAKHMNAEAAAGFVQVLLEAISLMDAIEDFRAAFPEDKDKRMIAIVGAGADVYKSAAELAEKLGAEGAVLKITGGAAGLISGIVDMLDAEDKALNAAINNNDYAAAVGHTITVAGASMTAIAGGMLLAEGISGGAVFGGPLGAVVGAIGAGLMALGMLVVAFFSDNDYQTFARHCFLGEKSGTLVDPDWATVPFGDGSIMNEFYALYDLIYRYKVNFVKVAKIIRQLPYDRTEWSAVELSIHPQYGFGNESRYHADVTMIHDLPQIRSKFEVKGLVLPDAQTATIAGDKTTKLVRRWSAAEVVDNMLAQKPEPRAAKGVPEHLHIYEGEFTLVVQLTVGGMAVGKPTKMKGTIGGQNPRPLSSQWGPKDFEEHHIEFE